MTALEISIDRRPARRGMLVVRQFIDARPDGADTALAAPVLRDAAALERVFDLAAEYCATKNMDPRWAALLGAFFTADEPCVAPERPAGTVAWLSPAQLALVAEGFAPVRTLAHGGERAGAYRTSCPDDLLEIWSTLFHLWHDWLAAAIDARSALGDALSLGLVDTRAEADAALADVALRPFAHRFGGEAPYPLPECTCGAPFRLHLWLDARDPMTALPAAVGAGVPLIFCNACDALWNDPLLAYVVSRDGVALLERPAACRQRGGRPGALVEAPVTIARRASIAAPHACPRCQGHAAVLASLSPDVEFVRLHPDASEIAWRLCPACAVVICEASTEGAALSASGR